MIISLLSDRLTAGVTGKGGIWRTKPPDAESAVWGRFPASAANGPHLSGARGVSHVLILSTTCQNRVLDNPVFQRFGINHLHTT